MVDHMRRGVATVGDLIALITPAFGLTSATQERPYPVSAGAVAPSQRVVSQF